MSNKWPIVSIVVGGALIGGSLLLKYLVPDEEEMSFEERTNKLAEAYVDGFKRGFEETTANFKFDHDIAETIKNDISKLPPYVAYNEEKPSIDELISSYAGVEDEEVEEPEEDESEWDNDEEEIDEDLKVAGPFVISYDSFANEYLSFSKNTITYFEKDGVVADDKDEVIVDYLEYIGDDALDSFGEGNDDPNLVYVRNLSKEADYEIVKDPTAYQETVLGFDDPYDRASKYFNLDDREE